MKKILYLFVFLHIFVHIYAQSYTIDILSLESGISSSFITSITEDRDGFLWIATESGLNRFDGRKFTVYEKNREKCGESINCEGINIIYADPDQDILWIGTQREGLNAYNYRTGIFSYYTHDPKNNRSIITNDVTDIISSKDGNLWIATYHQGIEYFDKKTNEFTHYNTKTIPELKNNQTWTIALDNDNLYIGHVNKGLSILSLQTKMVKSYLHDPSDPKSIPGNTVRAIYIDRNDNVWVGTDNGLALFNSETEEFLVFKHLNSNPKSLLSNYIYSIKQIDDNLYIGIQNGGVSILNTKNKMFSSPQNVEFTNITAGNGQDKLSNPSVKAIFQDKFGNIWLGTYGGGLNFIGKLKPFFNTWEYNPNNILTGLSNAVAWGLCVDDDGNLWIGTDGGGINLYQNGINKRVITKEKDGLSDNAILSAMKDSQGNLWFGTFSGGVNIYNKKERKLKPSLPQLKGADIRHFFEDSNKTVWISSDLGLFAYDLINKKGKLYDVTNSVLSENLIRSFAEDNQGNLWIGTFGQGLVIADRNLNLIQYIKVKDGLYSNNINQIFRDSRQRMWIATGEGLVLFPDTKKLDNLKIYTTQEGLTNNNIRAIQEDDLGNIWVSTNRGINKIDATNFNISNYTRQSGVPLGTFMNGSAVKTSDGTIYFGSQNGVCYFDPQYISQTIDISPTVINSFIIHDSPIETSTPLRSLPITDPISLTYKQNTFQVSFNTQNYAQSKIVEYSYMMKGLDENWMILQDDNSVTFRNIPYGEYQLQVKSRIKNQEWNDRIETLNIIISPPFWLSWWAKLIYISLFLTIIFIVIRFYKRKLHLENSLLLEKGTHEQEQKLNDERMRFYTNITHELRTPLTLIIGPLDDLSKDKTLSSKNISLISTIQKSAAKLLSLINQILEFRKTETYNKQLMIKKGNLVALLNEIIVKYKITNTNKDLAIYLCFEEQPQDIYFDPDVVTTIVDNLVSNAIKYTHKGNVSIILRSVERLGLKYIEIEVKDTGDGISQQALPHIFDRYYREYNDNKISGTGIGLAIVYNLVKLHQGEIEVNSQKGKGTSFIFRLQADNNYSDGIHVQTDEQKIMNVIDEEILKIVDSEPAKHIVLIVEDNEDICSYMKNSLQDYYEVIMAEDGMKGLELAQSFTPDIIISDIMMPQMDGIKMCRRLKKDIRTSHIPIILLTAKDSIEDRSLGYDIGADSYIVKPFNSGLLHSRITNILDTRNKIAELVSNNVKEKGNALIESINELDNEFLSKTSAIIEHNLSSDKLDVVFIANEMNMSHSTFYRKIKALTGRTANEYIKKIKMKNAERLLLCGRYTISEVSLMVGINSMTYFRQCIKDEFGMPPSEYIKYVSEMANRDETHSK